MKRSSIYTVRAGEKPFWSDPEQSPELPPVAPQPHFGFVYATRPDLPLPPDETYNFARDVIHCAPGTEPPLNVVTVVVKGHETPWIPEVIAAAWPSGHRYVMEAAWPDVGQMGPYQKRGKIIEIPEGVAPTSSNLVPHQWAGDGE